MVYDPDDENPLKRSLQRELENSEWLNKFKRVSTILKQIKADIPVTQLCTLKWQTELDALVVHCPNGEVWESLQQYQQQIQALDLELSQVILQYQDQQIILEKA